MALSIPGGVGIGGHAEIIAVPAILDGHEHGVQAGRHHAQKNRLPAGERRSRRGDREIRQNQAEDRQRNDHRQKGVGSLQVVGLLPIPQSAQQERQADHPVEDDHHHGKHGVPGDGRFFPGGVHHRPDHHHLNAGDGEGENQRPQRLAQLLGQMLGVSHDGKCRQEDDDKQPREQKGEPGNPGQFGQPVVAEHQEQSGRGDADR